MIKGYFEDRGITVYEELYALSEMIQWIWRSQIRDDQPIDVFIPSERMRSLFIEWLNSASVNDLIRPELLRCISPELPCQKVRQEADTVKEPPKRPTPHSGRKVLRMSDLFQTEDAHTWRPSHEAEYRASPFRLVSSDSGSLRIDLHNTRSTASLSDAQYPGGNRLFVRVFSVG
jgi:hypothetical protein